MLWAPPAAGATCCWLSALQGELPESSLPGLAHQSCLPTVVRLSSSPTSSRQRAPHGAALAVLPSAILQKRVSCVGLGPLRRGFLEDVSQETNRKLNDFSIEDDVVHEAFPRHSLLQALCTVK